LTGSKLVCHVLNREGHAVNYTDIKAFETEFAYSVIIEGKEAPDGIRLASELGTACVWDNNDANIETLHATVGHLPEYTERFSGSIGGHS
jgi:hypothetical protein